MEHAKQQMVQEWRLLSFQFRLIMMAGREGWRESRKKHFKSKTAHSLAHICASASMHSQSQPSVIPAFIHNLSLLYSTYTEQVRQIHELSHTAPSALSASWFRPAVARLAASGADLPHLKACDIHLDRTTGE